MKAINESKNNRGNQTCQETINKGLIFNNSLHYMNKKEAVVFKDFFIKMSFTKRRWDKRNALHVTSDRKMHPGQKNRMLSKIKNIRHVTNFQIHQ